jgi:hypothetical protein
VTIRDHEDDRELPLDCEDSDRDEDYDPRPRRRSHRGSTTNVPDTRVSKFIAWGWTALGAAFVTGVWLAANNLWEINRTLAKDAVYKEWMAQQLADVRALNDRQEDHINAIDRQVQTWEGRNLRGGPVVGAQRGK